MNKKTRQTGDKKLQVSKIVFVISDLHPAINSLTP